MMGIESRIAILASGSGTTANALAMGIDDGRCQAEIGLVVASKASAGIIDLAQRWNEDLGFNVRTEVVNNTTHPKGTRERGQSEESSEAICKLLEQEEIELVLQLGYMVIGNDPYISQWGFVPGRDTSVYDADALNWHPGLLPLTEDSYGNEASQIMLDAYGSGKVQEAAHSVHAVAQAIDAGPLFAVTPVPILPDDNANSLFARVQWHEKAVTPLVVDQFIRKQAEYRNAET